MLQTGPARPHALPISRVLRLGATPVTAHRWLFAGAASVPLERTRLKPPQDPTSSRWRHPRPCPPSPRQPPARCSRTARCPTTDAPARSPSRAASRRAKPLTHRVLSHRRDITPAQAPRDGSAHSCGSTQNYGATSAAARRCPWQQQVPPHHPPAASASLSHATPPPMHTSNATSDPAATGNIRGDEASASTDRHNSSVKLHVFALCR